ncbi:Cytosolic carboxypeptidase 3 [Terramyces sp. JEL0728]|nr:Cytosolic carboxypeptidase 3 [Terramyces sp. JEL0728]
MKANDAKKPLSEIYRKDLLYAEASDDSESLSLEEELEEIKCDDLKIRDTILTSYYLFRDTRIKLVKDVIEEKSTHWNSIKNKTYGNMLDSDRTDIFTLDEDCPNIAKLEDQHSVPPENTDYVLSNTVPDTGTRRFYYGDYYRLKEPRPLTEFPMPMSDPKWPSEITVTMDSPALKMDSLYIDESYAERTKDDLKMSFGRKIEPAVVYIAKTSNKSASKKKKEGLLKKPEINANALKFESRFESGNLQEAVQISDYSYELKLRKDLNTTGHTQWFYFRVENAIKGIPYKFKITNLVKPECLYNEGMKPLMYSTVLAESIGKGWHRVGEDISYVQNEAKAEGGTTFTLSFTVMFPVFHPDELTGRKAIILIARGFIQFLLGNSSEAEYLRANYVIKLIPMLNPDGVIVGNHRCNMNGFDLNRQWRDSAKQHINAPEVWLVKRMIVNTMRSRDIALFCDMHGHNRKHGIFLYGCNNDGDARKRYMERVFPYMLSKQCPSIFSFKRCQFQMHKKKEGTARIVMYREFGIINSFTLEASFCGSIDTGKESFHFNPNHWNLMGESLVKTLFDFFSQIITIEHAIVPENALREISVAIDSKRAEFLPLPSDSEDTTSDDEALRKVAKKKKVKVLTKTVSKKPVLSRPPSSLKLKRSSEAQLVVQNIESRAGTPIPVNSENKASPKYHKLSRPPVIAFDFRSNH